MRVVLDTNILISCCWKPGGNEHRVVEMVCSGQISGFVSNALIAEYREVSARRKFAAKQECFARTTERLIAACQVVQVKTRCTVCIDPDDNMVLECAKDADGQYVITGNIQHFPPVWQGVRVINAATFLSMI